MPRPLSYILFCLLLSGMYTASAQCPASSPLSINSVTTTESRCQASGTASVLVSGGTTPYTFSIISGPVLAPPQSSNTLQSLAAGNYVVQVTDNCNTSVTKSFSIAGTYSVPQLATTVQSPYCQGGSDGSIQIDVTNGRASLAYSLVSPSPVTVGPQAGNLFTGLPAGTYTCRVTDSCGNFQTRTVTLLDGSTGAVTVGYGTLKYEGCDSFAYICPIYIPITSGNFKPPYTLTLKKPDNTVITHTLNLPGTGNYSDTFHFRYVHRTGVFENIILTLINNCGASDVNYHSLYQDLDMIPLTSDPLGCNGQYGYTFEQGRDNSGSPSPVHCSTITYTLVSPAGIPLATQTNNSSFSGFPPGAGYKVVRQDCCKKDTLAFDWAAVPSLKIGFVSFSTDGVCKEGTATLQLAFNKSTQGDIVVASGPASAVFSDGTVHHYVYPDTIKNQAFSMYGPHLDYFTAGTWKLYAIDTCGQKDSVAFTIAASQLRHSVFSATLVKGCTGANKILLSAASNTSSFIIYPDAAINVNAIKNASVNVYPFTDSVVNLSAGTYYAVYTYLSRNPVNAYLKGMSGYSCDIIADTIVIPAYAQPLFDPSAAVAICGSSRQVALLPDTTRGVSPYLYQVISGPVTTSPQASPVFAGLPAGTYTFLMADACANSYSRSISVDTLTVPGMVTSGSTCAGGAATFTLPSSPFYSYIWQRPNGSTATGNTLTVDPITSTDTGTYIISVTSTLGGCTNTVNKSVSLRYCLALPANLLYFTGMRRDDHILLSWQSADEINTCCYRVERSADGLQFFPLQQLFATGLAVNNYTATDSHPLPGRTWYRLQVIDKNGSTSYSSAVSFSSETGMKLQVYPRLITGETSLRASYPKTMQEAIIQVVGIDGKLWQIKHIARGSAETSIDISRLAKGSYLVVFINNGKAAAIQVLKE